MNEGQGIRNGLARRIWLHICREGGTWTPEEIADVVALPREKTAQTMHTTTTRAKQLKRYKKGSRCCFGVTADCEIPFGITVKELAEVGVIAEVAHAG